MTFREHGEGLLKEVGKWDTLIKCEGDYINKTTDAYKNWQHYQNKFNKLLSFIIKEKRNLDDTFTSFEEEK